MKKDKKTIPKIATATKLTKEHVKGIIDEWKASQAETVKA